MLRAAKPAPNKITAAEELEEVVKKAESILLADFTGITVAEFDKLRSDCYKNQVVFRVAKNRIAKIVFDKLGYQDLNEHLTGPTGFAIGFDDPITPIKLVTSFFEDNKKGSVKGCLVEGQVYGPDKVDELKNVPPREQLIASIVGGIASPLSGFVFLINEIVRSFVGIIDALAVQAEGDSAREGLSASGGSVENIIESIEKMTVLELVELKKALEDKFGVTAAAPVAAAGPAAGGEAAEAAEEQTEFTVILTAAGDKKIQVIKEVRAITGLGLKEAKALVDESPKPVKEDISKDEAMAIKAKIEEAGGQVELK